MKNDSAILLIGNETKASRAFSEYNWILSIPSVEMSRLFHRQMEFSTPYSMLLMNLSCRYAYAGGERLKFCMGLEGRAGDRRKSRLCY